MNSISTVIITRNEEAHIAECLKSVLWTDEIIVADSFSTDRTAAVCRKFKKVKFFSRKFTTYADQKNWALGKAKNPWILSVDADERVTPELKNLMEGAVLQQEYAGFEMPRKNFFFGRWVRYGGLYPDFQTRLFRKEAGRFNSVPLHEGILLKGPKGRLNAPLLHYSYTSVNGYFERFKKYTDLEKDIFKSRRLRINPWTVFLYALFLPVKKFLGRYILKLGFLDGLTGFMVITFNNLTKLVGFYKYCLEQKKR